MAVRFQFQRQVPLRLHRHNPLLPLHERAWASFVDRAMANLSPVAKVTTEATGNEIPVTWWIFGR